MYVHTYNKRGDRERACRKYIRAADWKGVCVSKRRQKEIMLINLQWKLRLFQDTK
jgi:hypothetical protein